MSTTFSVDIDASVLPKDLLIEDLLREALDGDTSAFRKLEEICWDDVIARVKDWDWDDPNTAEDISRHTFRKVEGKFHTLDHPNFVGWMYTIAENLCRDEWKKQRRRRVKQHVSREEHERERKEKERLQVDLKHLKQLPEHQREMLEYRLRNYKYREIADTLGLPMGTVKTRILRGTKRLKKCADAYYECLEKLNHNQIIVCKLAWLEDYKYQDIAVELGIPIGTVNSRISRGAQKMDRCLRSRFPELFG